MKKILLLFLLLANGMTLIGKTTYLPSYRSYIHIVEKDDTISVTNMMPDLELSDRNGFFTIRIEHEDVTKEKVRAIKRAKRAAGWATISAVMSGVSTAFSDNSLDYMIRSTNTQLSAELASIYSANAVAEEILDVYVWIDNTTNGELMVNDMDRGLMWCVLPNQSLKLKVNNPEACRLRISDAKSDYIRYASVTAGSKLTKWTIAYEDEECWIVPVYQEGKGHYKENIIYYKRISKADYTESGMPTVTFYDFMKKHPNYKEDSN